MIEIFISWIQIQQQQQQQMVKNYIKHDFYQTI